MKIRYYALVLVVTLALGVCGIVFLLPAPQYRPDLVQINDLAAQLANHYEMLGTSGCLLPESNYDYAVIDNEGNLLAATRQGISEDIYSALRHGDMIVDITKDGQMRGRLIVYSDMQAFWKTYQNRLQLLTIVLLAVMALVATTFLFAIQQQILIPFHKMRGFAQRIASGDLDAPLSMDKRNVFGAFTESFDLMRDELRRARENERAAEQSKRELVATLSHDIQTPLASIKAVSELMEVTASKTQREKLKTIQGKTSQIQTLVTQLFHTTLEELDSLNVQAISIPSSKIEQMIMEADYQGLVNGEVFPGCLVLADPVRLAQVMDNIIANSYKYACTKIQASAEIDDGGLIVNLRDSGSGVAEEELPRLCSKYFRGESAQGKDGYGLGLFIAHHLVGRMGGRLECRNAEPGFLVRIWLELDG